MNRMELRLLAFVFTIALGQLAGCGDGGDGNDGNARTDAPQNNAATFRGETTDHWTRSLQDRDPNYRVLATNALEALGKDASSAVPALIEALGDAEPAVRAGAAQALAAIGPDAREAEPALQKLIDDKNARVRISSVMALGAVTDTPSAGPMADALRDPDAEVRNVAADLLVKLGEPAVADVARLANDKDENVRLAAVRILGRIGHENGLEALADALDDENPQVQTAAVNAFGETGAVAVPRLTRVLGDDNWRRRYFAVYALGLIGGEEAAHALIEALDDEEDRVAALATDSIIKIGPPAFEALAAALNRQEAEIRVGATTAAAGIGGDGAVTILATALKDAESRVREVAVNALSNVESRQALPLLADAMENEDPKIRTDAMLGLVRFGEEAIPVFDDAVRHEDWRVRMAAAEGLGRIARVECVPSLNRALRDEDANVRTSAARGIGEVGPEAKLSVTPLIKALGDENADVRDAAANALVRISPGNTAAVPAIIRALRDPQTRLGAANTIAGLGSRATAAVYPLIDLLKEDDPRVVTAARIALGRLGQDALPALLKTLDDPNPEVRVHVIDIIGQVGEQATAAIDPVVQALVDNDPRVREAALAALGLMGRPAREALLNAKRNTADAALAQAAGDALDTILKQQ